jgi:hypothetical protein
MRLADQGVRQATPRGDVVRALGDLLFPVSQLVSALEWQGAPDETVGAATDVVLRRMHGMLDDALSESWGADIGARTDGEE